MRGCGPRPKVLPPPGAPGARPSPPPPRRYSASPGGKNARENVPGVVTEVETRCTPSVGPCEPVNTVVVTQTAKVGTRFAGVLGLDEFTIRTRAAACAPCGSRPVDVVLVLDRTLSMCQDHDGRSDATCRDLTNAKAGLRAFLRGLDSTVDRVGLVIFPPARGTSDSAECAAADVFDNYNASSPNYVVAGPASTDPSTFPSDWLLSAPGDYQPHWARLVVSPELAAWHDLRQ